MSGNANTRFSRGASSMVSAGLISRLLGILIFVPMQNLLGNYTLGIYQLVYPLYTIMLTLATAGFPIALSKTISDLTARGKYKEASMTYAIVGRSMLVFGLIAFFVMWFGGPIALEFAVKGASHVRDAIPAIRALAPALLILPLMSAQRGYLQGNLRLEPSGASQVVEQIMRVSVILIGLLIAVHLGAASSTNAAIATFGGTAGAIAGFALLLAAVKKTRRMNARKVRYASTPTLRPLRVMRQLFIYSLPIALGTLVLPISQNIDNFTIIRELVTGGMSYHNATVAYGIYAGEALRLMALPLSFATAIGASVMPAITEVIALGHRQSGKERLVSALRMTAFITMPAIVSLALLAVPLDIALFKSAHGADLIVLAAIMCLFSSLELVSTFLLQGYDRYYQPVAHMGLGAAVKLILNLLLIPVLGISGAAWASIAGYALSSWLNMIALRNASGSSVTFTGIAWRPLAAAGIAALWLYALGRLYSPLAVYLHADNSRLLALLFVFVGVGVSAPIYLIASLWIKAADKEDLIQLPMIGRLANRYLTRK